MPYYHCKKCHHEFEAIPYEGVVLKCDWCEAEDPKILEDETPLEKLGNRSVELLKALKEMNNES